jgi:DNA-binding HxlR family transcriptional regulator
MRCIVQRIAFATIPPRVDYALTSVGLSLATPLSTLASWASNNRLSIEAARASYDPEAAAEE